MKIPDQKKTEAVKHWLACGNLQQTAAELNLSVNTLKYWRYSDWWEERVKDIKTQENIKLHSKLKVLAEKSLDLVNERLENGDYIFVDGEIKRKPVSVRDATAVANVMLNQAKNDPAPKENAQAIDRLEQLAERFEKFAQKKIEVTDVLFVKEPNALHDKRQA